MLRAVVADFFFNCWYLEIPSNNREEKHEDQNVVHSSNEVNAYVCLLSGLAYHIKIVLYILYRYALRACSSNVVG
jgi:hypothetical protein